MDLVFGVLIFMLAVGVIYALFMSKDRDTTTPLRIESEVIAVKLSNDPLLRVTEENQLNIQKLNNLTTLGYEQLRTQLGVKNEFCIYLEDEQGNVVYIINGTNKYTGIGSGSAELNISGTPCGQICTTC
jgi:hypothetical protein